ncbi:hypothetical protein [Streptomyces glaucescens]|uniref:Uncharacterized protein n=1 Tax=Streptomyces glaucescens TaxID=1907 RepID=A0A089X8Q6_STRGA|nr:hypothetical protein [Streptomyces glaucescens]AIR99593.1 hypothetical protein SGLAU_18155 [Streptomyces glaucescens]
MALALTTVAVPLGTEAESQGRQHLDPLAWLLADRDTLPLALRTGAPVAVCLTVDAS